MDMRMTIRKIIAVFSNSQHILKSFQLAQTPYTGYNLMSKLTALCWLDSTVDIANARWGYIKLSNCSDDLKILTFLYVHSAVKVSEFSYILNSLRLTIVSAKTKIQSPDLSPGNSIVSWRASWDSEIPSRTWVLISGDVIVPVLIGLQICHYCTICGCLRSMNCSEVDRIILCGKPDHQPIYGCLK